MSIDDRTSSRRTTRTPSMLGEGRGGEERGGEVRGRGEERRADESR